MFHDFWMKEVDVFFDHTRIRCSEATGFGYGKFGSPTEKGVFDKFSPEEAVI